MNIKLEKEEETFDEQWRCLLSKFKLHENINIKVCLVEVESILQIASVLTKVVQDKSWMLNLDKGSKRAYNKTVDETALKLVEIFDKFSLNTNSKVGGDFGELLVSIGSSRALNKLFSHKMIPIAELWKPQVKQNEGFDFHTVCKYQIINFGEAKFSSLDSPYSDAINQANDFIKDEKHLRDRVHLVNLVDNVAIENLDNDDFGIIASFSVNTIDPLTALINAVKSVKEKISLSTINTIYLVGVKS